MLATSRPDDEDSHRSSLVSVLGGARAVTLAPVDEAAVTQWLARTSTRGEPMTPKQSERSSATTRRTGTTHGTRATRSSAAVLRSSRTGSRSRTRLDHGTPSTRRGQSTGERAVAVGVTRYLAADGTTVEREYHNVFLLRFDDDGRCTEFTELYMPRAD